MARDRSAATRRTHLHLVSAAVFGNRPRWSRHGSGPAAPARRLRRTTKSCAVVLPLRMYWSDSHNRFDLADPAERRMLYQTVLRESTTADVVEHLYLPTLLDI